MFGKVRRCCVAKSRVTFSPLNSWHNAETEKCELSDDLRRLLKTSAISVLRVKHCLFFARNVDSSICYHCGLLEAD